MCRALGCTMGCSIYQSFPNNHTHNNYCSTITIIVAWLGEALLAYCSGVLDPVSTRVFI